MKLKLDEDFGPSAKEIFERGGHQATTVREEGLGGAPDSAILRTAVSEDRILVTMDLEFGHVLLHPPEETRGIVVLRPPGRASRTLLRSMLDSVVRALERSVVRGRLWVVEPGRIREHESTSGPDPQ